MYDELGTITLRPYHPSDEPAEEPPRREGKREAKKFRPTIPSDQRDPGQVILSSGPAEDVQSILQNAQRRQELDPERSRPLTPQKFRGMSLSKWGAGATPSAPAPQAPSLEGVDAPRKLKMKGSAELMDLAFTSTRKTADGQFKLTYAPISLPYVNVTQEEQQPASGSGSAPKQGRPSLVHVDEANSNAAKALFQSAAGDLLEDTYFLMQLPPVLPELSDPTAEVQREQEDDASAGAGASITRIPDGKLGKIRIHKSGKVKLDIGGLPFSVDQGSDTFFGQHLACVCPEANEIIDLGPISKRMVVTPDVDAILADLAEGKLEPTQTPSAPSRPG